MIIVVKMTEITIFFSKLQKGSIIVKKWVLSPVTFQPHNMYLILELCTFYIYFQIFLP